MKTLVTFICIAALASSVLAETFNLKDTATGKTYGPFFFNPGETIRMDKARLELVLDDPRHNEILATTRKLTLPSLNFKDASLADIALFITETCRRQGAKDLGIVVSYDANGSTTNTITQSMDQTTLYDALCRIAEATGNQWTIRHGTIVIEASGHAGQPAMLPSTIGNDAGRFSLKVRGIGKTFGPFRLQNKTHIQLDGAIFEVVQVTTDAPIASHLKTMKIPTLDFRDAGPKDVALFLNETIKRLPDNPTSGIQIELGTEIPNNEHHVTCSIRNQSLYDALGMICESSGMEWTIADGKVILDLPHP